MKAHAGKDFGRPEGGQAMAPFKEHWQLYRKMVDNNFPYHREAYARLHEFLVGEVDRPFRFLDVACGDAGAAVSALLGTRVVSYHGIDLSRQALRLAARAVETLDCPVKLERGDFVAVLARTDLAADVVWIGLSLHHLVTPDKLALMRDVRRILAAGGLFLVYEPASPDGEDRDGWLARYDAQRADWTAYSAAEWEAMWTHTRAADFPETTTGWHSLGESAGFAVVRELYVAPTNLLRLYCFSG